VRILHISDLHFGAHNDNLAKDLQLRARSFDPPVDVILATGDLADQPEGALLREARTYLDELQSCCCSESGNTTARPPVLVIPGNHDVRYFGNIRFHATQYWRVFSDLALDYYDQKENVWIYGFDSSLEVRTGANGRVSPKSLGQFRARFEELRKQHGERFEQAAFKIIALHHHPLPIKYDDKVARWLTLTNAGEFLGEMLKSRVDLILHGHEHIRASVRYGRTLPNSSTREVPVLSVGTALKRHHGEDRNCFYLIDVRNFSSSGEGNGRNSHGLHNAFVTCYEADKDAYSGDPQEPFALVSEADIHKKYLDIEKVNFGYVYGDVSSIAKINSDGDSLRIIECHELEMLRKNSQRASAHDITIPYTSGYIDKPFVKTIQTNDTIAALKAVDIGKDAERQWANGLIEFNPQLSYDNKISYQYGWWAVNGFALNQREAAFKYGDKNRNEFTHYPVRDPIEALTVVVQFPEDPGLLPRQPFPRVVNLTTNKEDPVVREKLRKKKALRTYESLRTVALRVSKPLVGYSYGIEWAVPLSPPAPSGISAGQLEDLRNALLRTRNPTERTRTFMQAFLCTVNDLVQKVLLPNAGEEWEIGLMVFDPSKRRLVVAACASVSPDPAKFSWKDYSDVEFRYGEGIGGKAFKTNKPRLYVQLTEEERHASTTPDFYLETQYPPHAALLGIPLQSPEVPSHVYAVICCGVAERSGKLWELGQRQNPIDRDDFKVLQTSLNSLCFELLKGEFLAGKKA
jgi:3',5'-cyclic AMP phosphodiesterase CpdA